MAESPSHLVGLIASQPARPFPIGDWQFWAATVLAALALGWLLRAIVPWRRLLGRPSRKRGRRATLTLEGVTIEHRRKGESPDGERRSSCH